MSDFFSQFFGFGESPFTARRTGPGNFQILQLRREARPQKAPDLAADVTITLEEAMAGSKRRLELNAEDECEVCGGTGMIRQRRSGQGAADPVRATMSKLRRQRRYPRPSHAGGLRFRRE